MKFAFLALLSLHVLYAPLAWAQHNDEAALGQREFAAGRYPEALEHYQRAYEATGAPILLYNIGQTADRLRLDATTLRAFQMYLQRYPDAPNREEVHNRIEVLEPLVARRTQALAATQSDTQKADKASEARKGSAQLTVNVSETLLPSPYQRKPPDEPVASPDVLHNPWFWIATGAVIVALVSTVVLVTSEGPSSSDSTSGTVAPLLVIRH